MVEHPAGYGLDSPCIGCIPGSLAIVEGGPTVSCNHTYVGKRHAAASVVQLALLLGDYAPRASCRPTTPVG